MTKEVWISPRADGFAGNGTPGDPLDGSDFDALTPSFGPGMTIHLGPGVYTTLTGWTIPARCTVRGAGMFNTTIVNSEDRVTGNFVVGSDWREDGCIAVSDLTIAGRFTLIAPNIPIANRKVDGLVLFGNHNVVERVQAIDWGGTFQSSQEAYGILLAGRKEGEDYCKTAGSSVRNCVVHGGSGNYGNGIGSGPASHDALIEGCTVFNVRPKDVADGHGAGFNCNGAATVTGCATHGCRWGFYSEGANGLKVTGNRFLDCYMRGVRIWIGSKETTIADNYFEMREGIALEADEKDHRIVTTTRVVNNVIRCGSKPIQGIMLPSSSGRGQQVLGNSLDAKVIENQIAKDAVCLGNRTLNGGLIGSLPDKKGNWKK